MRLSKGRQPKYAPKCVHLSINEDTDVHGGDTTRHPCPDVVPYLVTATAATTPIFTVLMLVIVVVTTAAATALMTTEELLDLLWGSIMLIQHFADEVKLLAS
jgi:hypothetical protein